MQPRPAPRRLLVAQTAYVGDVVLTTPLLRELHRLQPEAEIHVLATPAGCSVLEGQPHVDGVRPFAKSRMLSGQGLLDLARTATELRRGDYEVALAAQRSFRTGLILSLARIPLRIGFAGAPGEWAYHRQVPWRARHHATRRYLDLCAPLGGDPEGADPRPSLVVQPAARETIRRRLEDQGIAPGKAWVCVAPGSARATKRWTPQGFARVVAALAAKGVAPVLVGNGEELRLCREVRDEARAGHVLAGETSLPELIALVAGARALVGNDSAPAHIASALGVPVVAVFGPTSPDSGLAPRGPATRIVEHRALSCRPCSVRGPRTCPRGHFRCMRDVDAADVLAALDPLLGWPRTTAGQVVGPGPLPGRRPG
jgi:heptosyltransferase-2